MFALADRILVLASGAIVASGPPEQIRTWMAEETWMDPREALARRFTDEIAVEEALRLREAQLSFCYSVLQSLLHAWH